MAIYEAKLTPYGTYEVWQDGKRVATTSVSGLSQYGLSADLLYRDTSKTEPAPSTTITNQPGSTDLSYGAVNEPDPNQKTQAEIDAERRAAELSSWTNAAKQLLSRNPSAAEVSSLWNTIPAEYLPQVQSAVPELETIRVQGGSSDVTTGGGTHSSATSNTLSNSLNVNGPTTIFLNGQEVDIDANGNIVATRPYQGDMNNPPKNGSTISSDYAPRTDEELNSINSGGTNNVFTSGLADNAGYGTLTDAQRAEILANQTAAEEAIFASEEFAMLSEDQQGMLRNLFNVISTNDDFQAQQLLEAFQTAKGISEPYFAQQISLVSDALERGFVDFENELAFKETQLQNRINDLREDVENQRDFLTFQQQQEINKINRNLENELEDTRNKLAAKGFTFSTRRARTEGLLNEVAGEMRESTNRSFGYKLTGLQNDLNRGERDTQQELARLQELGESGRLDLARKYEAQLGSNIVGGLTNVPVLGGIQGSINQQMSADIFQGAQNIFDRKQGSSSFV